MGSYVRKRGDIYSTDFTVRQGTPGKSSSRLLASKGQELISDQPTRADGEESASIFHQQCSSDTSKRKDCPTDFHAPTAAAYGEHAISSDEVAVQFRRVAICKSSDVSGNRGVERVRGHCHHHVKVIFLRRGLAISCVKYNCFFLILFLPLRFVFCPVLRCSEGFSSQSPAEAGLVRGP